VPGFQLITHIGVPKAWARVHAHPVCIPAHNAFLLPFVNLTAISANIQELPVKTPQQTAAHKIDPKGGGRAGVADTGMLFLVQRFEPR
jgi:hypothetical protein